MIIRVYALCPSQPCITDNDHDGLSNEDEFDIYHTNPNLADTDSDRLGDGTEVHITHTNPLNPDTDGEGLSDGKEHLGWVFKMEEDICPVPGQPNGIFGCTALYTDPLKPDTDGDGYTDWQEWCLTSEPTDPTNPRAGYVVPSYCGGTSGTVNVPPVVGSQTISTNKNTPIKVTLSGTDQNGDKLTFVTVSRPSIGTLSAPVSTGPTFAQVTYTPKQGFTGIVTFTFMASDGKANSNLGKVTINVVR
jgi:hypothetical protein